MKILITFLAFYFCGQIVLGQRAVFVKKDSIQSSLDGNTQVFYFFKTTGSSPQPLVVELHSWSFPADSLKLGLTIQSRAKNWNYIYPDYRGVNNHAKACFSEYVIADIDEAIDWALKNMSVDKKRIYVVGNSSGGTATLAMYMKSRHKIHSFSAWQSLSDLEVHYRQSLERKDRYAADIIKCIGAIDTFDREKAKGRSPLYWKTPVKKRKKSILQIYAGIQDGHSGPVPISHSINFYNKILSDSKEKDSSRYVSGHDTEIMLKTRAFTPQKLEKKIEDRIIHYQNSSKNVSITIFEGKHEILRTAALELLSNPK